MAYVKKTWVTNEVITSTALNHIEGGIQDLSDGDIATLHQTAPTQNIVMRFAASDELRYISTGPWTDYDTVYSKVREKAVPVGYTFPGTVRAKFDLRRSIGSTFSVYGRIYVNGVAVGVEHSTASGTAVNFSDDVPANPGDMIELWIHGSDDDQAEASNFALCATDTISEIVKDAVW